MSEDIVALRACLEAADFDKDSYAMESLRKIEKQLQSPVPQKDADRALGWFNKANWDERIKEVQTIRRVLLAAAGRGA